KDIFQSCYILMLLLADAVLLPQPGEEPRQQARRALDLLQQAALLRDATRGYHLRRVACLAQLEPEAEAAQAGVQADALREQPADAVDYFLMGNERYQRKDLRQAIAYFEEALARQPDHFWAQFLIAVCYLKSQRPAEAKAHLSACLNRKRDYVW